MLFSFIAQINEALLKHEYSAVWWLLVDIFMTYQHSTRLTDNFFARQKNVSALQTWNKDDEKKIRKNITCFWDHTCIRNNWRTLSVISLCGMIAQHKRLPGNKQQKNNP